MPLTFANTVTPKAIDWLWPGYLPFGMVTVVDGDPGLGKSTLMLDLAARLSTGRPLPNGRQHEPCGTLLFMGEDATDTIVVPRLINAGADLARVAFRDTYHNDEKNEVEWPAFPDDLDRLEADVKETQARLVVIDPIMAYLAPDINSNNDQQVRRALMPFADLADQLGIAIVLLRHLNKATGGSALYRGGGSIGFVGVARSALIVARDPDNEGRMVLALNKTNLGPPVSAMAYRLVSCENGAARVEWDGHSEHTADSLVQQPATGAREGSALAEAVAWLREMLDDYKPHLSTEVYRQAAQAGIARDTVYRAKGPAGVKVDKARTQHGGWTWRLLKPGEEADKKEESGKESDGGVPPQPYQSSGTYHSYQSLESNPLKIGKNGNDGNTGGHPPDPIFSDVPLADDTKTYKCSVCGRSCFVPRERPILCTACNAAARGWSRVAAD